MTPRLRPFGVPPGRRTREASGWIVAGVVTVAIAGGVGTASLVQSAGARTVPDAAVPDAVADVAAADVAAADVASTSGAPSAGGPAAVPEGLVGDVRPLPLPQLVDRDTVGPLWLTPQDQTAGVLSLEVPESASGVLHVVPGSSHPVGTGPVRTVRVEVERGLAVDGAAFAATVMGALSDPRGWGARGDVAFARTDGPADIRVVLASPDLVDALCAPLDTGGQVSCGRNGHAALNVRRWVLATPEFADREEYRRYLVNHEVGHLLGHPHERCPGAGLPAPIMQQQSLAVAPCEPNGWPYPQG